MKDNKIIFKKESNYGHHYDKKKKKSNPEIPFYIK